MNTDQLETPVAIVDLQRLGANIRNLQGYLDQHGIINRPHIKTHKIPEIARMQVNAGAAGVTCQKIGEAEVMADAGVGDIFVPYNIIGGPKLKRLMRLARRTKLSVTADSPFTVDGYSEAARQEGIDLPVLVEFDTGMGRCGVQSPQEAASLARLINRSFGLRFGGLMTHPFNEASDPFVSETKMLLATDGIAVEHVSYGGTPTMWQAHDCSEITEYRAGTYVYGDRATVHAGAMSLDDCAFHVLATVVSRPTADRGILDAGSKILTLDLSGQDGHGLILEYPEARIYALSEEHGFVDFSRCKHKATIGERVTVLPNHCCVVSNLFDQVVVVKDDRVEMTWPVAARGKAQ